MRAPLCLLVTLTLLTGCVTFHDAPTLSVTVDKDTMEWGHAVQVTIKNEADAHYPAPVPITILTQGDDPTPVRTIEDVTGDRGIQPNGQITFSWNGLNDDGDPILWGDYTMRVGNEAIEETVTILQPPNYALTVDPDPREAPTGSPMTFIVNNTGTVWLNGTLTVAAGKDDIVLYENEATVQLAPDASYEFRWQGYTPDGEEPEPDKYLIGAIMDLDEDGPTPFGQDVFDLTE